MYLAPLSYVSVTQANLISQVVVSVVMKSISKPPAIRESLRSPAGWQVVTSSSPFLVVTLIASRLLQLLVVCSF